MHLCCSSSPLSLVGTYLGRYSLPRIPIRVALPPSCGCLLLALNPNFSSETTAPHRAHYAYICDNPAPSTLIETTVLTTSTNTNPIAISTSTNNIGIIISASFRVSILFLLVLAVTHPLSELCSLRLLLSLLSATHNQPLLLSPLV